MMFKPVKIRFEKGSYFVVIPKEALEKAKLKRGDYVIPVPEVEGLLLKKIKEVEYGRDKKDPY